MWRTVVLDRSKRVLQWPPLVVMAEDIGQRLDHTDWQSWCNTHRQDSQSRRDNHGDARRPAHPSLVWREETHICLEQSTKWTSAGCARREDNRKRLSLGSEHKPRRPHQVQVSWSQVRRYNSEAKPLERPDAWPNEERVRSSEQRPDRGNSNDANGEY